MPWLSFLFACVGPGASGTDDDAPGGRNDDDLAEVPSEAPDPLATLFADAPVEIALALSPEAIAGLAASPAEDPPEVEGTFSWGDETRSVGVKLKGGYGSFRTFDQKPSFTLDFEEFGGEPLFGLRHVHLNNLVQDVSMLGEHAAYRLLEARNVPAPRHGYARLTVNGEPFGLYGVVDKVDRDLLRHHFGTDEGVLIEGEMDDFESYLVEDFTIVEAGGDEDPYAALHAVIDALDAAPWDARGEVIAAHFDRDAMLDAWAVEVVSGNDDGYVTWINNYFLWHDPADGRFAMIPWGPDQAFLDRIDVLAEWRGRLWTDCRNDAACDADLRARIVAAAEVFEDPDYRGTMDEVAEATAGDCAADPRSESAGAACAEARAAFFTFLDERAEEVRARVGR